MFLLVPSHPCQLDKGLLNGLLSLLIGFIEQFHTMCKVMAVGLDSGHRLVYMSSAEWLFYIHLVCNFSIGDMKKLNPIPL